MLFEWTVKFLGIIGLPENRHINSFSGLLEAGLSSQGIFGRLFPFTMIPLMVTPNYSLASSILVFQSCETDSTNCAGSPS